MLVNYYIIKNEYVILNNDILLPNINFFIYYIDNYKATKFAFSQQMTQTNAIFQSTSHRNLHCNRTSLTLRHLAFL